MTSTSTTRNAANDAPRLGPELLYLLQRLPRERWPAEAAHGTAGVWLNMHASLRHGQRQLEALAQQWQHKAVDWVGFRKQALPMLDDRRLWSVLAAVKGHREVAFFLGSAARVSRQPAPGAQAARQAAFHRQRFAVQAGGQDVGAQQRQRQAACAQAGEQVNRQGRRRCF